jgi:hypothetical protein
MSARSPSGSPVRRYPRRCSRRLHSRRCCHRCSRSRAFALAAYPHWGSRDRSSPVLPCLRYGAARPLQSAHPPAAPPRRCVHVPRSPDTGPRPSRAPGCRGWASRWRPRTRPRPPTRGMPRTRRMPRRPGKSSGQREVRRDGEPCPSHRLLHSPAAVLQAILKTSSEVSSVISKGESKGRLSEPGDAAGSAARRIASSPTAPAPAPVSPA